MVKNQIAWACNGQTSRTFKVQVYITVASLYMIQYNPCNIEGGICLNDVVQYRQISLFLKSGEMNSLLGGLFWVSGAVRILRVNYTLICYLLGK